LAPITEKVIVDNSKNKLFLFRFVEKEKIEKAKGQEKKEVGRTISLNSPVSLANRTPTIKITPESMLSTSSLL
jgi:hypothetical protein